MKTISTSLEPSENLLKACAQLGVAVALRPSAPNPRLALARRIARFSAQVAFITGPSGSGKSRLLRAVERAAHRPIRVDPAALPHVAAIDIAAFANPADPLALLARVGLAEAPLLGRTPRELSDGQRWRLALAVALARAGEDGASLIADEFTSLLDRVTARAVARALRRVLARNPAARFIGAGSHDDILPLLAPGLLVRLDLAGNIRVTTARCTP